MTKEWTKGFDKGKRYMFDDCFDFIVEEDSGLAEEMVREILDMEYEDYAEEREEKG